MAARFAREASRFRAEVRVHLGDAVVDGKSVLELITLVAECGSRLDLEARGTDAEEAVGALIGLLAECSSIGVDGRV